jgi:anti-sigma-K factor RskA
MKSICDELEELIPAYALDALAPTDRVWVEKHLRDCPSMQAELDSYQNVAARLSAAVEPAAPSAGLKYRVIDAMAPRPPMRWGALFSHANYMRPALAGLALALLLVLIGWNVSVQSQLNQQITADRQLATELSSQRDLLTLVANADPAPKRLQGTGSTWNATGRLYAAANDTTMALVLTNMPPLSQDQVYQVWLTDRMNMRTSGGTFTVDSGGRGWLVIRAPQILAQYQAAGVTVEPKGGSPQPTGARIVFASFAQ